MTSVFFGRPGGKEVPMTGEDFIEALKRAGEWGSYFTDEGYEFVKDLRSSREICIALHAWGATDAREADSAAVLVEKLHRALEGDGRSPLSRTGLPGFHL
jgi:hypothetical protein